MGANSSAIITTAPNAVVAQIHGRVPAVVQPQDYAPWLDVTNVAAEEALKLLNPPEADFVFEPAVIARASPPPKPKAQLSLL